MACAEVSISLLIRDATTPLPFPVNYFSMSKHRITCFVFRYMLAIAFLPSMLTAQHPEHQMPPQIPMKPMAMMVIDPLAVSMERMCSGTPWLPDAVPFPARHVMSGSVVLSLCHLALMQYYNQGGSR